MKKETGRMDTAEKIAKAIIEMLEKGVSPWHRPWKVCEQFPKSAEGREYRGINVMVLSMTACLLNYKSPYWLTFRKVKELGGNVRKGEHGTCVMYWKRMEYQRKDADGKPEFDKDGNPVMKSTMLIRGYHVFNADQCDGLPDKYHPAPPKVKKVPDIKAAKAIWEGYNGRPPVRYGGHCAYSPDRDIIIMVKPDAFDSMEHYYAALFHEGCHSTGHKARLDRKFSPNERFGDETYSKEELVAEIGAQFLCQRAGITRTLENSAAYCKSWAKHIKSMPDYARSVITAAAQAQRAADWILGTRPEGSAD